MMRVLKRITREYYFDLVIFLFLAFQLYLMKPEVFVIRDWCSTPYALNYSLGLGSRFFIGSVVRLLTPYLTMPFLHYFICGSLLALFALLAFFFGECVRSLQRNTGFTRTDEADVTAFALIALYLASPASPAYLFHEKNFGRLDIYFFIFTLISLFLSRTLNMRYLIILLSVISVATHQVYVFTLFPLIFGVLLYNMYENDFDKRSVILFSFTVILTSLAFVYFQFYSKISATSVSGVFAFTFKHARVPINLTMIEYEYFRGIADHAHWFVNQDRLARGLVAMALISPLLIMITFIFIYSFICSESKMLKFIFIVYLSLPLMSIPAFALTVDWGRWFALIYAGQILLILYLAMVNCAPVIIALKKLSKFIMANLFLLLIIVLFFSLLGKYRDDEFPVETNKIVDQFMPNLSKEPIKINFKQKLV